MKRLLTLILTFILTISGVFPAFADFKKEDMEPNTTQKYDPDWVTLKPSEITSTEWDTVIRAKDFIFILPVGINSKGEIGQYLDFDKSWHNAGKTIQPVYWTGNAGYASGYFTSGQFMEYNQSFVKHKASRGYGVWDDTEGYVPILNCLTVKQCTHEP